MAGFTFSSVPLIKAVATGNDFLMVDLLSHNPEWRASGAIAHPRAHWVKAWCDRHFGLGADGALFLEAHPEHAFAWDFYNSDGSSAELCGNAARAASLYYYRLGGKKDFSFMTRAGSVNAKIHGETDVEVGLSPVAAAEWGLTTGDLRYDFVRAGVPHALVTRGNLSDHAELGQIARQIKSDPRFATEGTNVTFVKLQGPGKIESVTFERGVEGFTLACGTGAVAAAYGVSRGAEAAEVSVRVPGGRLSVCLRNGRPHLRGEAKLIAEARWIL